MSTDALTINEEVETVSIPTRPSMKERQWHLREDAILDAATDLLKSKGFNAMTLEDITEAIGISRPTLYQHFKSKEDVATKVAIRNLDSVIDLIRSLDATKPASERLKTFCCEIVKMRFDPTRIPMYDLTRIKLSQACHNPELRLLEQQLIERLVKIVQEAQQDGDVWAGVRPEMLVLVTTGFLKNFDLDGWVKEGKTTPAEVQQVLEKLMFGHP